jgi:prophage regulatory protein
MRLLTFTDLKQQKGIPYCRDHLRRKVNAGEFPQPIEVGPGRIAWVEEEVDAHLDELAAKRFGAGQPTAAAPAHTGKSKSGARASPERRVSRRSTPR